MNKINNIFLRKWETLIVKMVFHCIWIPDLMVEFVTIVPGQLTNTETHTHTALNNLIKEDVRRVFEIPGLYLTLN